MTREERSKLIDELERLRFFNQRAGRELWGDKSRELQNEDIKNTDTILDMAISELSENMKDSDLPEYLNKEVRIEISDNEVAVYDVPYEKSKALRKILEPYLTHVEDWDGHYIREEG